MSQPPRIIAGGIHHETNSFTPLPTTYDDFSINRGLERYADDAGVLAPLDTIALVPTFVANALPGGLVQRSSQGVHIGRGHEQGRVAGHLWQAGSGGGDDRRAASVGFQQRQAKAFVGGRIGIDARGRV